MIFATAADGFLSSLDAAVAESCLCPEMDFRVAGVNQQVFHNRRGLDLDLARCPSTVPLHADNTVFVSSKNTQLGVRNPYRKRIKGRASRGFAVGTCVSLTVPLTAQSALTTGRFGNDSESLPDAVENDHALRLGPYDGPSSALPVDVFLGIITVQYNASVTSTLVLERLEKLKATEVSTNAGLSPQSG
eukprot:CAMPEP_0198320490 /NCGR_PEP_ID=MMETSP1450-20131203/9414_1 /TAXON_ID=753684 ORGANISM="Madagascaria erythrocladiodes, Strain CCMP3234" /NCGR_SAMPLE_ID=MMETSP1450 /ASSEMBLY_ACC=CAM_ASM_001115 /LENGTH=188 /DNA_ID=CAMNT_0044023957 /DNA_START=179 /DNA_END=746 /DNA_ORIENTATION=-